MWKKFGFALLLSSLLIWARPGCKTAKWDNTNNSSNNNRTPGVFKLAVSCLHSGLTRSNIQHLVVIIQENHSFDSYFGNYCQAPVGSSPQCTQGPNCCEAGPRQVSKVSPVVLTDDQNLDYDPNHLEQCELAEINGGKMDRYVTGAMCSNASNFAYADSATVSTYWDYATKYALADRYFQPSAGASSENDMYFARGAYVFSDNRYVPNTAGSVCYPSTQRITYTDPTVGDLLATCEVPWSFYAEGYADALNNPNVCKSYPTGYDPSDNPFEYYKSFQDNPRFQKDFNQFGIDISSGALPAVSFIKPLGIRSEHPGISKITDGEKFVSNIVNSILNSPLYQKNTLILVVPDESGGFYDHISPPPASTVDHHEYGPRVPFLAIGYFAKEGYISHVTMEHTSIIRFIEWNFLDGNPGQLGTRDTVVNGIGSLLDPAKTGQVVP